MTLNHPFNVLRHVNQWEIAPRGPFAAVVGAFLFPGLVGAGSILGVSLATVAGFLVTTAVTSWLVKALSPKAKEKSRGLQTNVRDPIAAHEIVYGEVRKGGVITFMKSSGTGNRYLHMILVLAGHEVEAINNIYINDEVVTWNSTTGLVTTAKWNSKIRIRKFLGGPGQVASSELISEAGVTSNFVGNGIAYLYIRLDYDQKVFAEGIPTFTAVVRGKKVFDPATATTAYSNLSSLCIRDYLVSAYGVNQQAFANSINDTYTNAATTICNQNVSLAGGGTEKRYTVNGVISTAQSPKQNLELLLSTCGGTLFWSQGQWHIKVGAYSSPTLTFTESDLRSDIGLVTKNSRKENFNTVQGVFNDASQRWLEVDYPEIKSATFITQDGGEQSIMGMDLPLTTSAASAQRLAKMALFRSREQFTFVADFALTAARAQPGDTVSLTLPKYGFSAKPFEVLSWNLVFESGELLVRMTLKETSAAAYDWAAEESSILANNTTLPDPTSGLDPTNLAVTRYGNLSADGSFVGNAKVSWDASVSAFISYYTVQWKRNSDTIWSSTTTSELSVEVGPIEAGVVYNYRVMATSLGGFTSAWVQVNYTLSGDNTIPSAPTSPQALGGYKFIELRWINPVVSDLSHVNIYVNTTNNSGTATLLGKSTGTFFIHGDLSVNTTRYYWLKAVDFSGNESTSFSAGVSATTNSVPAAEVSGQLSSTQIADGAISIAKFAAGLQPIEIVATLPTTGNFAGRTVFLTADSKLYRHTGSPSGSAGFTSVVATSDLTGTLNPAQFSTTERPIEVVATLPTTGNFAGRTVFLTADSKLYRHTGSPSGSAGFTSVVSTTDLTGTLNPAQFSTTERPIEIVATLPTTGNFAGRTVFLTTDSKLYRHTGSPSGSAGFTSVVSTTDLTGTLNITQFASTIRPVEVVGSLPVSGNFEGRQAYLTTDGKLYRYKSGAWTKEVDGGDLIANSIVSGKIAAGAISATELAANAVTAGKIAAGAVTTTKLAAGAVTANEIAANAIIAGKIAAGAVTATELAAGAVTTAKLAAGAVTANELAANAVIAGKIAAGVVTTTELAAGAVTTAKLAANAVTANEIAANAVTTGKIAAGTVTSNELAANSVIAGKIQAGAVNTAELAAGAVTAGKLAVVDTQNLALNGDFVYQFEAWGRLLGSPVFATATELPGGRAVQLARVTSETSLSTFGNFNSATDAVKGIPVNTGEEFYIEAYSRRVGATNPTLLISVIVVDSSGAVLSTANPINVSVTGTAYAKFSGNAVAGATGFAFLRIQNNTDNSSLRVGAVKWYRRNAGELIVDGSITANKLNVVDLSAISADMGAITAGSLNINNKFIVASNGDTTIQSAATGERLLLTQQRLDIYDASNNLRIRIGLV